MSKVYLLVLLIGEWGNDKCAQMREIGPYVVILQHLRIIFK